MSALARFRTPIIALLFALGLFALAAGALRTGFLNDDYIFLEQARASDLPRSLGHLDALGNYFRPLSRQLYFAVLTPLSHGSPRLFHLFNFAVFLGSLALLADVLMALLPPTAALAGVLYFALLPLQRVAWLWISCSQDLLALFFALAAFAFYRRSRPVLAAGLLLAACASKESALALPIVFLGWDVLIERRSTAALKRVIPCFAIALLWGALALMVSGSGGGARWLHFAPASFLAALVHEAQSVAGLDSPAGLPAALMRRGPDVAALIALSALTLALPWGHEGPRRAAEPPSARRIAAFSLLWMLVCGLIVGPVAATWSAYYYMLGAVGAAALVALAARSLTRASWPIFALALLWWHAGGTGVTAFAVEDRPWGWTSHLTSYYFERAAALTDTLSRQMRALESAPPRGTRFFFATLPPWAGFQMGSGALIRQLYDDPSLSSWFYSQFSESTAADHPCRFLYWDGRALRPLYPRLANPFFQVGGDLLLLDHPAGASHAFHRGLAAGGERSDLLYWLGWAEIWRGRRESAEAAWLAAGAREDSARWAAELRAARRALDGEDTLLARRHLAAALFAEPGRPVAHEVLGELMLASQPKYALLELSVAAWLDPADMRAHRLLAFGLARARLEAPARRHLEAIQAREVAWRSDSALVRLDAELRVSGAQSVVAAGP